MWPTNEPPDAAGLYERHAPSLRRYLTRMCGDADLAADAVQETFTRMLQRPAGGELERAWLFRVGTNLLREWGRTRRRRMQLLEQAHEPVATGTAPLSPEIEAERSASALRVRSALARLPERDRTILLMREEGFTHREIAEAVGTTTKSVGTLIARALTRLARELPLHAEGRRG